MKHYFQFAICVYLFAAAGCTTDKEIKQDIAVKAKTEVSFAGVTYTVKNKVVTLSGTCSSEKAHQKVLSTVRSIHVVSDVNDGLSIAPVELNEDMLFKQSVDSILGAYPQVFSDVQHLKVTLKGNASTEEMLKLLPALKKINPVGINNQVLVQ